MSPNRIVALLTPLVFAPLAGTAATLAAKYFPGTDIPASSFEEIFIAGALIALAKSAQWTQGWQKYEAREAERESTAESLDTREAAIAAREAEFAAAGYEEPYADEGPLLDDDPELDFVDDPEFEDELDPEFQPAER
jgi:hypothetical protein